MDLDYIENQGISTISPIVCTELKNEEIITNKTNLKSVKYQNTLFNIEKK